jgi:hypothetical protein
MLEDVVGTQTATRTDYGTCAECGNVFRRNVARVQPAGLTDDSRSEFTELCPDCDRLNSQGERVLALDPD